MNKFYKLILPCACAAMLSFTACSDDDKNGGGEGTELTPEQNKQKLESIGLTTIGKINAADHADLLQTIDGFSKCIDDGDLELERHEEMDMVAGLLADIRSVCAKANLGGMSEFASPNYDLYRAAEFYGIYNYEENSQKWGYTPDKNKLEFRFNVNGKPAVVTVAASGKETKVEIDEENDVMIPENVEATISKDGKELCKLTVTLKVDDTNKTADIKTQLSANGYVFLVKTDASNTTATASYSLTKNNEVLISAAADLTGENLTNGDIVDNDNAQDLFKGANVVINIINEATIKASCSDIGSLINLLERLDEEYSWMEQYKQPYNQEVADAYNTYIDAKLYYTSDDVIANFKMQVYYDEDDYYYESGNRVNGVYDTEAVIVFTIDDSSYSFDSYFDEISFNDLINSAEKLGKQYEKYLKYLCD